MGTWNTAQDGHCAQSRFIKIIVDDIVRGLDPKNNGQGQALFELSIEAVATSTHLNPSIKWLQAVLNSLVSKI